MILSRRFFLEASAIAATASATRAVAATRGGGTPFTLEPRPTRVIKTADRSHENTETWIFSLVVQTATDAALTPAAMKITLLSRGTIVRETDYPSGGFGPLTYHTRLPPLLADGGASPTPIFWPFVVRLRHTEPIALGVDAMNIHITAADPAGRRSTAAITVPVETYQQKTALIFPFRGKGIVLQAGASNGGHRNRSGEFALDACGLDDAWSVVAPGDGKRNSDYPGWGRPLLAPADGTIVRARGDRPDQPAADVSDPNFYAPEYKNGGDPGNHLVIDHGSGEFSMIAHFMAGSMLVKTGDRVHQGQALGELGHSGDTDTPHCHYQLQAGPDWENSDALPCKFSNVDIPILDRGTYFEAK